MTGIRNFFYYISVSVFPWAVFYRMFGVFGWPKTKAIVVFAGKNYLFDTCSFAGLYPLPGIQFCWVKYLFAFVTQAPFPVCKSVYRKMQKAYNLQLLPAQLPCRRGDHSSLADDSSRIICG